MARLTQNKQKAFFIVVPQVEHAQKIRNDQKLKIKIKN